MVTGPILLLARRFAEGTIASTLPQIASIFAEPSCRAKSRPT
jgi:hypothetical protein